MGFLVGLLSIIVIPIIVVIWVKLKVTKMRRMIKKQLKKGNFLKPMDKKDVDMKVWGQCLDEKEMDSKLANLQKDIFTKKIVDGVKNG